jgi:putative peptidoglycan lipid II flippase
MEPSSNPSASLSTLSRVLRLFRPSHQHTELSATFLLMTTILASRVIGYLREMYIAYAFGAGSQVDAYVAAFTLPDWLNYMVAGGTASITFIAIYTRFVAQNREPEAQKTFSIIITVMTTVLLVGIGLGEIYTTLFVRWMFHGFNPEQVRLCVFLTRILLPAQVFFYAGGVVSAVLLSKRLFLFPALGPVLYNIFIIAGGIALGNRLGIAALAWGALLGSLIGPFLINAVGAARIGTGYRPSFDVKNAAFREWVKMSIPLMLGVSLVAADDWILRYFASSGIGDIARLNYAKRLFAVPIAVLGQATGQASLPFFAKLFGEKRTAEFSANVSTSVYRISALSFLVSGWMMAAALPIIDLVYRRGRFGFGDAQTTAVYFFWFSVSLAFWSAQALYARAFYATTDTLTPMIAASVLTILSVPVYSALFHTFSVVGLAIASDLGIIANTVAVAYLLHRRRLVPVGDLQWKELGKSVIIAAGAGYVALRTSELVKLRGSRTGDVLDLLLITVTWAVVVGLGLWLLRSTLPRDLRRRQQVAYPRVAERQAEELSAGIEP